MEVVKLGFNIKEICQASGVGRSTIYKEINEGHLEAMKIRGRTIITMDNARKWLEERASQSK